MHSMTVSGQSIRLVDMAGGNQLPLTPINCYSALSIPAYTRAIRFLADNLASFPRSVRRDGAQTEEAHPLNRLLKRRPNALQAPFLFWRTLYFHAAHTGNGYARVERNGLQPVALHNLEPEQIVPFRLDRGEGNGLEQWYWHRTLKAALPAADVLHIQGHLSYDGLAAMDPVALHESTFQRAATIERYQVQYLRKGTVIRGAIEIPNSITPEQREEIRAELRKYRGDNDDDVLILSDSAKLTSATTSAQQSQLVEQGQAATKAIAQMTGVPPEFLYELTEAKYNASVEQQGQNVVRYTFRPWITAIQDELTVKLLSEAEQEAGLSVRLNPDALLRGSTKEQADTVIQLVNAGLQTPNEGRNRLELPAHEDPQADELHALGDSRPAEGAAGGAPAMKSSRDALAPIIAAAAARVDAKTAKAFTNHAGKSGQDRTIWANVFAEEQKRYVVEALSPIAAAAKALGATFPDVAAIADSYAGSIRKRASTGLETPLSDILAKG